MPNVKQFEPFCREAVSSLPFQDKRGPIFFRLADQITALLIDAKGDRSRIEERLQEAGMETEDINLFTLSVMGLPLNIWTHGG